MIGEEELKELQYGEWKEIKSGVFVLDLDKIPKLKLIDER